MLDHSSHSEPACLTTDQVRLAAGFGEALERLRVELDEPISSTVPAVRQRTTPRSMATLVVCTWSSIRKELMGDPQRLNVTVSSSAARCVCAELTFMDVSS